ncbi:MAG: hypothetical protein K6L74_16820 [Neptuniibacter sp.]
MSNETQDYVVCGVAEIAGGWNIRLGPGNDAPWVTVSEADYPIAPAEGDIATVRLPKVTQIVTPFTAR